MEANQATLIGIIVVQGATLASVLAAALIAAWRAGRERQWVIEDREYALTQQRNAITEQTKTIQTHTSEVVGEAKVAAEKAFNEANDVNLKIASLGIEHAKTEAAIATAIEIGVEAELLRREKAGALSAE